MQSKCEFPSDHSDIANFKIHGFTSGETAVYLFKKMALEAILSLTKNNKEYIDESGDFIIMVGFP